ncbi:MAG: DinB family protein [Dehalococcoidia bacterium]
MADALSSLTAVLRTANQTLLTVMDDLTIEQANWLPPGTANTIAQTYAHIVTSQDHYLNRFILAQDTIWTREGWADRLGLPEVLRMSRDAAAEMQLDPAAYRAYAEQVFAATEEYVATLTDAELTREVEGYRGPIAVVDVIGRLMTFHATTHLGEIAAIKGIQGLKGLLF